MNPLRIAVLTVSLSIFVLAQSLLAQVQPDAPPPYQPTAADKEQIQAKLDELANVLKGLTPASPSNPILPRGVKAVEQALLDDVLIFQKAGLFMLRYGNEEFFLPDHVKLTLDTLDHGIARATQLASGKADWPEATGQIVQAYRSKIDGDLQPYALSIPESYNPKKPIRLDVSLHGFSLTINEASFIASHDSGKAIDPAQDYIKLEVFGRTNNGFRWGGEADVLEAIEAVQARYNIDPNRIVLRGFSMGGAGAWAVGLHHPDRWAALEAGAGGVGSRNSFKPDNTPPHPGSTFRTYNMVDWALNAANVPTVGYGGELDPQLAASVNIREQLETEGYQFELKGLNRYPTAASTELRAMFLVGPQTEHKWHPDSKKESEDFIVAACAKGREAPKHIRYVTYSTRYGHCFNFTIDGLERHYDRSELDALTSVDARKQEIKTKNISRLLMEYPVAGLEVSLDGQPFPFKPTRVTGDKLPSVLFEKKSNRWQSSFVKPAEFAALPTIRKKPGIQGPINDFMMDSFLVVRPTGQPNNDLANDYAIASLNSFVANYAKWLRADVRVKDDRAVTREDVAKYHLVLFGDPASNSILAALADLLPIKWTKQSVKVGKDDFKAEDHVPSFICANPKNPNRYIVVNAGQNTMKRGETRKLPVVNFQRLGDYAVLKIQREGESITEQQVLEGLFDEDWQVPRQ
jgi:pimeloyl-ACP methyl ester carboxylesterase